MGGTYWLGIDVGTTFTAAAVRRDRRTEVVQLGSKGAAIPSVVLLRADGELLTGETARRRGMSEPDRVASEFKRRVGDPVPVLVGGTPWSAEALLAKLVRWVVDTVAAREGGPPAGVAVTHPANWGPYKLDLVRGALRAEGLPAAILLSEPEASAHQYASHERVPPGAAVAVYDLGGGTFDCCVLRRDDDGNFAILGEPEGIERLGGVDLDQAVLGHVRRAADDLFVGFDGDDPAGRAAAVRLREECTDAKEQLSSDVDAVILVALPGREPRDVRITRAEFEALARPVLADTVASLERTVRSAGVEPAELHAVLLIGGSSRIPLIGELVSGALGRPVAVDADPKLAVAQGAALAAEAAADRAGVSEQEAPPVPAPEAVAPPTVSAARTETARSRRRPLLLAGGAVVAVAAVVGAVLVLGGGDDPGDDVAAGGTTSTTDTPTTPTTDGAEEFVFPDTDFAHITGVRVVDVPEVGEVYAIDFETNYERSGAPGFTPNRHVHFFWDTTPRATAGNNGTPAPGIWLAYGDDAPAIDPLFAIAARPEGATAVCALVATPEHNIADVTGDGAPDPDSGDCHPLPD